MALNWLLGRPTVSNVFIGARDQKQLVENIGCLGWTLTAAQAASLEGVSHVPAAYPVWHQRGLPMLNERI